MTESESKILLKEKMDLVFGIKVKFGMEGEKEKVKIQEADSKELQREMVKNESKLAQSIIMNNNLPNAETKAVVLNSNQKANEKSKSNAHANGDVDMVKDDSEELEKAKLKAQQEKEEKMRE